MGVIEEGFKPITGYLISMERDTVKGWYTLKIGLPKAWVFDSNESIGCEILKETNEGKVIKIAPKTNEIGIDDLVAFVNIIVDTNVKIAERKREFDERMERYKEQFEEEAKKFYTELDELKDTSFKKISIDYDNYMKNQDQTNNQNVTKKRGRKPKKPENVSKDVKKNNDEEVSNAKKEISGETKNQE